MIEIILIEKDALLNVFAIKQSLCYCKLDPQKAEAISKKTVYSFFIVCQSQGFFNKVSGQSIFRGQQVDLLSWFCFVRCLLLPFFAFFLHCRQYLEKGALCHGPTLEDPLEKSETDSKGRPFLQITMFLGQKINKTGTDSK